VIEPPVQDADANSGIERPADLEAPRARKVASRRSFHGDEVVDEFAWLRDGEDPETVAYLEAENRFAEQRTAHLGGLREQIYTEIAGRTQQTDTSVPVRHNGWWYFTRTTEGLQYPVYCRVPMAGVGDTPPAVVPGGQPLEGEELLLDGNAEAGGSEFFAVGALEVGPDGRLLAFSTDTTGDERFTVRFVDLTSGQRLDDVITGAARSIAWSSQGDYLFYATVDDAWRPDKVWRHELGSVDPGGESVDPDRGAGSGDTCVRHESDERFWLGVGNSRDERWVMLEAHSKITSEVALLDAGDPTGEFRVVAPRRTGVEYTVEPAGLQLLVLHNDGAEDFELAVAPLDATSAQDWRPVLAHTPGRRLTDVLAFPGHVAVGRRAEGLAGVSILPRSEDGAFGEPVDVRFDEAVSTVELADTPDYVNPQVRVGYTSLVTPDSVYDLDLATGQRHLRKQRVVLGGYDPGQYEQHREWATADDGTAVPISLVCRKGTPRDATNPFLLYGYGSYEIPMDPSFSIARLSLLDRGFVFAIAHIRGGGEMGRRWYEEGKLLRKANTFTDFVACARHVVDAGWTSQHRLAIRGFSAGGLLMGAVANLAPDAFRAVHAGVPFVDALTTILNPELPLTVIEWDEWGDPLHDPEVYAYMKAYSPYENVAARPYPAILATTSLNDTRVLFSEPAKWVAKLRDVATGTDDVLLQTEMSAGHGGRSGRYDAWRQEAFELAWICDQVGATETV